MAKKIRDETIIDALLISATVRSAAAKLEINEQTIYRRKRDPEFMQKYNEARRERTEAARNVLQERRTPLRIRWQRSCRMQTRPHRPA